MRLLPFREPVPLDGAIALAVQHLDAGGILSHPTETVYGFGCTLSERALAALARLKGRETGNPFLLLVSHANDAPGLEWNEAARRLASVSGPDCTIIRRRSYRRAARSRFACARIPGCVSCYAPWASR